MTTTAQQPYRVARIVHEGSTYYPVMAAGRMLGLDELETLAREADVGAPTRKLLVVIADEGMPRPGADIPPMRVRGLSIEDGAPVTYLDSQFVVGRCESISVLPAGALDGAEGEALVATVVLLPTRLSVLTWEAVQAGYFTGLCPEVVDYEDADGRQVRGRITRVILGDGANSCLPGARVVRFWEGEGA
jgi:hypothetical protein